MEQLGDLPRRPLQQGQPVGEPDRGPFLVPIPGVAGQGGVAAAGEGAERAGVQVDVPVQERELGPEGLQSGIQHRLASVAEAVL